MDLKSNDKLKTKKVVFIVGTLNAGGIERIVSDFCVFLANHSDYQPVVICILKKSGQFLKQMEQHGIPVFECKLKNTSLVPFTVRMATLLKEIKPDVVHSQVAFSLLWQVFSYKLAGIPTVIFTQHNEYQNWRFPVAKLRLRIYYFLSRNFIAHYTCVSEKVRDALSTLLGTAKHKFLVVANAVDTKTFRPMMERRQDARRTLGVGDNEFVIGMVARFAPQKGQAYLIEAAALLLKDHPDLKLVFIGSGERMESCKQKCEELSIAGHVIFFGNSTEINILLQGFDCFVLPSLWEGMPISLIEAMSCGIPVIASNVTGNSEVIDHRVTGILVPPADVKALKDAIGQVIQNPAEAKKMSEQGLKSIQKRFDLPAYAAKYITLYQQQ